MDCNEEGFLLDHSLWNESIAHQIAATDNVTLSAEHFEVLYALRQFYDEFDHSPAMRPLVSYMKIRLGAEKATSIYLLQLFPGSPAKFAAKYAGLPKPDKCL